MTSHQCGLAEQMLEIGLVQRQIKGEKKILVFHIFLGQNASMACVEQSVVLVWVCVVSIMIWLCLFVFLSSCAVKILLFLNL